MENEPLFIDRVLNWLEIYGANAEAMFPIVLSFLILVISIAFVGLVRSRIWHRMLFIVLAGAFYLLANELSDFGSDYFSNLSAELIGAFLATIIFAGGVLATSWLFPFVFSFVIVTVTLLTSNALLTGDIGLNLSTELLGAFMTVVLLDPEWIWFPGSAVEKYSRQTTLRQRRARRMIEGYHVTSIVRTKREIQDNIDLFRQQGFNIKLSQSEKDGKHFIQELVLEPRNTNPEATYDPLIDHNETVQVNLTGRPSSVSQVYRQMKEVLECTPQRKEQPERNWIHIEVQIQQPEVLMSDYLEHQLRDLIAQWQQSQDKHLQQSAPELESWAHQMNFMGKAT